jgi:uncharacterized protein YpmB
MYITPGITEEQARDILSQKKSLLPPRRRKKRKVPLKRVELIYLPFYLFEVAYRHKEGEGRALVSLDGLLGDNLFFVREDLTYRTEAVGPVCPFELGRREAEEKALDKYKWLQVEHGLRMKHKAIEGKIVEGKKIFYPFWVGYIQRGKAYDFRLADGVSGEVQGVRMRKVFLKALRLIGDS